MDKQRGKAAWTCSIDMKPWTIGHAARTYRMETKIRQGRAANALSEAMKLRHAAWIGSMEVQHGGPGIQHV
jgi:hypothetical protein